MKLKINKACDLSSISVLPPPTRRSSAIRSGSEPSLLGKIQGSQLRSQTSQQSFSQGISSQHGMFSQFSQNSLEEILTNEQRIGSEEKENSVKKVPSLPMVGYSRDESQMVLSRPSTNQLSKWSSTASADHRSQKNEGLEHRILSMENSLNRFVMILDHVQTDIMQANKGTKEVLMEMEGIRHKLAANDNMLQQMTKGQEDIKSILEGGFKSISDQVSQDLFQEKLKEISAAISALKGQIDVSLQALKPELCKAVAQQMQEIACSLKIPQQKELTPIVVSPKAIACSLKTPQHKQLTPIVVSPKSIASNLEMPVKKQWTPIVVSSKPIASSLKKPIKKQLTPIVVSTNVFCLLKELEISRRATPKQIPPLKKQCFTSGRAFRANQGHMTTRSQVRSVVCGKSNLTPKVEVGSWTSVKPEQATIPHACRCNVHKQKRQSPIELDKEWRIPIESDEEINGGFSCLFEEKETGSYLMAEVKEETDRILRRARKRKRKSRSIIILN